MNPIIEINSATSIKWTNPPVQEDPNGLNISVRVSIFKDSVSFQVIDTPTQSGGLVFDQLPSGIYTIKFKTGWSGTADSIVSNSVMLGSQVSATPTIISFNATIPNNGSANISLSGVVGASMYSVRNSDQPQYIGIVDANGVRNYSYTNGGSYKYYQIESGKSQSAFTSLIQITDTTMLSCDNGVTQFSIASAIYNQTTSVLTFVFNASNLSSANYKVTGSNGVTTAQGNVSPTSSTVNITLPQLGYGTFTLEIVGTSCTGTATRTFSVIAPVVVIPPTANARGSFRFLDEEAIDLFSSGNIASQNSTGAGYRWIENGNEQYIEAVVNFVDVVSVLGYSGIGLVESEPTPGELMLSPRMICILAKNNGSIVILARGDNGALPVEAKVLAGKSVPIKLRMEKVGTEMTFSYSNNIGVLNDTFTEFYRVTAPLYAYRLSLLGSSGVTALQTTQFKQVLCSWGVC